MKNVTNGWTSVRNTDCRDMSRYSAVGIVKGPRAGRLRIRGSIAGKGKTLRAMQPTQSPTQAVQGAPSPSVRQPGCKFDHSPQQAPRLSINGSIHPIPYMQ
jgi:hypothetical protein